MEPEAVLNLFDSMWFHLGILEKPPTPSSLQTQQQNQKVSRQISFIGRSKSDDLSSFTTQNSTSTDWDPIKPHLQTILSDKEVSVSSGIPKSPVTKKPVIRQHHDMRRKKQLSKSMSELEFEEVKGFIDMGFVFSEEAKDDRALVEIIPGLQKLGQRTECRGPETGEKMRRRSEEGSRMSGRPYLSEAWEFYEEEEKRLMKWRVPLPAAATNEMDIKDSLKSWAHTVASAVR
ncbi:hypothetical protein AAHA92_10565 [Salvia divinorum]|uniref:DUF1685 family protein n=1 Tax=Salvia divinorum TaxID=28513 RepID=A0ABD1HV64_SALDI